MKSVSVWAFLALFGGVVGAQAQDRRPRDPAFSPSGQQIAYSDCLYETSSDVQPYSKELWVINSDSSGARQVTQGHQDTHPRWSPDGKQFAFVRNDDIWTINADGTNPKNLTNTQNVTEDLPEWTNGGAGLLFLRDRPTEIMGKLWDTGFVVAYKDLATGKESRILDTEFGVERIVPDPVDSKKAYVICNPLDLKGQPLEEVEFGTAIIASVDLITKKVSPFFSLNRQQYKDRYITNIKCARNKMLVEINGDWNVDHMALLEKGQLNFLKKFPTDADIISNGSQAVAMAVNKYSRRSAWGLLLYDTIKQEPLLKIETGITDPKALLAKDAFVRGNVHYDAARYKEAVPEFTEAIRLNPQFASAFYNRASCYWMLDENDRAIADLDIAIALNPVDGEALVLRGEAYAHKGDHDKAAKDFTSAAVSVDEADSPGILRKRAASYRAQGFTTLAESDEREAAELENTLATKDKN